MKYRVVEAYNEAPENPITVSSGDVLDFLKESDPMGDWPDWILCRGDSKEGWVPRQILIIEQTKVRVTEDYSAREHNLTGEDIIVSDKELNGWVWGYKESEPEVWAWAPLNCLTVLESD